MNINWVRKVLFLVGIRGNKCKCGFYSISHIYPELEFDIEYYPCNLEANCGQGINESKQ